MILATVKDQREVLYTSLKESSTSYDLIMLMTLLQYCLQRNDLITIDS